MTWVLLRGLTREARHWGGFAQQLAAALPAAETAPVVALDLPGNGAFHREASPRSVRGMTDFARAQLLARGLKPPYQLVAMSLGAMVAADWALHHPGDVLRLVLVNTSMRPHGKVNERLRPASWLPLARLALHWHDAEGAERIIHRLTCNNTASRDEDLAVWARIRRDAPVSAANAWRQLGAAAAFRIAAPPPCPTLLLSSAADRLVDPRCTHRLANAWQATHNEHPWAGHDLPHDDPGWVCGHIADWLAS